MNQLKTFYIFFFFTSVRFHFIVFFRDHSFATACYQPSETTVRNLQEGKFGFTRAFTDSTRHFSLLFCIFHDFSLVYSFNLMQPSEISFCLEIELCVIEVSQVSSAAAELQHETTENCSESIALQSLQHCRAVDDAARLFRWSQDSTKINFNSKLFLKRFCEFSGNLIDTFAFSVDSIVSCLSSLE